MTAWALKVPAAYDARRRWSSCRDVTPAISTYKRLAAVSLQEENTNTPCPEMDAPPLSLISTRHTSIHHHHTYTHTLVERTSIVTTTTTNCCYSTLLLPVDSPQDLFTVSWMVQVALAGSAAKSCIESRRRG